eukprot:g14037.t1
MRPQRCMTFHTLEPILNRVLGGTVMRMTPGSLSKLYQLALAALKQQLVGLSHPSQVLTVTNRHLHTLCQSLPLSRSAAAMVVETRAQLGNVFASLTPYDAASLHRSLLTALQQHKVKVYAFLQASMQHDDGVYVMPWVYRPGRDTDTEMTPVLPGTGIIRSSSGVSKVSFPHPYPAA